MKIWYKRDGSKISNSATHSRRDFSHLNTRLDAVARVSQGINGDPTTIQFSGSWKRNVPISKNSTILATQELRLSSGATDDFFVVKPPNYFTITRLARQLYGDDYRVKFQATDRMYDCNFITVNKNFVDKTIFEIANEVVACSGWIRDVIFKANISGDRVYSFDFTNTSITTALREIGEITALDFFVNTTNQIEFTKISDSQSPTRADRNVTEINNYNVPSNTVVGITPAFRDDSEDINYIIIPASEYFDFEEEPGQPINEVRVIGQRRTDSGALEEIVATASDITTDTPVVVSNYNSSMLTNSTQFTNHIPPIKKRVASTNVINQFTYFWEFEVDVACIFDIGSIRIRNMATGAIPGYVRSDDVFNQFQLFRVGQDGSSGVVYIEEPLPKFPDVPSSTYRWSYQSSGSGIDADSLFYPRIDFEVFGDPTITFTKDDLKIDLCAGKYLVAMNSTSRASQDRNFGSYSIKSLEWYPVPLTNFNRLELRSGRTQQQYDDWLETNTPSWFRSDWQIKRFNDSTDTVRVSYPPDDIVRSTSGSTTNGTAITDFRDTTKNQPYQLGRVMEFSRKTMQDEYSNIVNSKPSTSTNFFDGRIFIDVSIAPKNKEYVARKTVNINTVARSDNAATQAASEILQKIKVPRQSCSFKVKKGTGTGRVFTHSYPSIIAFASDSRNEMVRVGDIIKFSDNAEDAFIVKEMIDREQNGDFTTDVVLHNQRQDTEKEIISRLFPG